jgi:acyl-CoA thioesterase-1
MREDLIFVALGDSLTVGFQSISPTAPIMELTPYTYFLDQIIAKARRQLNFTTKIRFVNKGVNGELTEDMLRRFERDVIAFMPNYVIILGGSNDLGWGLLSPEKIFHNLRQMYTIAIRQRIKPIACTVPSILGFDSLIPQRLELNSLIKQYCSKSRILCVDIFQATANPQTQQLLDDYSNDGLHLSTAGYKKVAETIFQEAVKKILSSH